MPAHDHIIVAYVVKSFQLSIFFPKAHQNLTLYHIKHTIYALYYHVCNMKHLYKACNDLYLLINELVWINYLSSTIFLYTYMPRKHKIVIKTLDTDDELKDCETSLQYESADNDTTIVNKDAEYQDGLTWIAKINFAYLCNLLNDFIHGKIKEESIGIRTCDVNLNVEVSDEKYIDTIKKLKEYLDPQLTDTLLANGDVMNNVAYDNYSLYNNFGVKRCVFVQRRITVPGIVMSSFHFQIKVTVIGIMFHKQVILDPIENQEQKNYPINV